MFCPSFQIQIDVGIIVRDHEVCTLAAKDLGLQSINMVDDVVQVVNAMKAWERNWS